MISVPRAGRLIIHYIHLICVCSAQLWIIYSELLESAIMWILKVGAVLLLAALATANNSTSGAKVLCYYDGQMALREGKQLQWTTGSFQILWIDLEALRALYRCYHG